MRKRLFQRALFGLILVLLLLLPTLSVVAGLAQREAWQLLLLGAATLLCGIGISLIAPQVVRVAKGDAEPGQQQIKEAQEQVRRLAESLQNSVAQLFMEQDRATLLSQSLAELMGSPEPQRSLERILHRAIRAARAREGSILLIDEEGRLGEAFLSRSADPAQREQRTSRILDKGFAGWVVQERRGSIINDTTHDARWVTFPGDDEPARSAVGVPFLPRERVLGVMVLTHPEPFQFAEKDLTLLQQLAQQAAICLENATLYIMAASERSKLNAILDGTADAIIVVDTEGQVALLNQAAEQAFRVHAPDIIGLPLATAVRHPDLTALFAKVVENGEVASGELDTDDGRVRYGSVTPIAGVGWVAVVHDITYLKELDRLKSDFVAAVSHDLRSPLTRLLGFAELLPRQGPLTREQQTSVERIRSTVAGMAELIHDLLDLARVEAGIDMGMQPCDLEQVVTEAVDSFLPQATRKGLELETTIEGMVPVVKGNAPRLCQVVANLIDNAIKYTPAGGTVRVRISPRGSELVVAVTDTGIGIAAQDQEQLFQGFYRIHTPQTAGIAGTGLGLAIARSIIEQHAGRIWVRSAVGHGSTFAFALPAWGGSVTRESDEEPSRLTVN